MFNKNAIMSHMKKLVIMAGGMSRRMGQDKVFLKLNGETFLERIFLNGRHVFSDVFISVDTKEHADEILKLPALKTLKPDNIILDIYPKHGPIGGLVSVFEKTDLDHFAVLPTDVPFADMRVLTTLFECCKDKPCVFKRDNEDLEPLIGAYSRGCYETLKKRLDEDRNSLFKALEIYGYESFYKKDLVKINPELAEVDFEMSFRNINFPEDYKDLGNQ